MCALRDKPRWFMLDGTSRIRSSNGVPLHVFLQVAGYATHAVLPEPSVIPIRADAPLDVVCLVSCGVLAGAGPVFNRAKVPPGASVAVWGCGGVGLNTIQAAKMLGAGKIIAVDVMKQKLQWAEEFGATHGVDASKGDPVAEVQRISGMGGVDSRSKWSARSERSSRRCSPPIAAALASSSASAPPVRGSPSTHSSSCSSAC
jgi:S-(hydroxymethyl)glutathione dehydrogenase/alcohol dehydrogenase